MSSISVPSLQGDDCPVFPHVWTAGDKNPGLVVVLSNANFITNGLTVKMCLERPTTPLEKTFTNVSEEKATMAWDATPGDPDLVAGIGQLATFFTENGSGEKTHLGQFLFDVREGSACP